MTLPQLHLLLPAVLAQSTHAHSFIHGEPHWRAVAWTALDLAPLVPGSDPELGLLFGLCHDAKRLTDSHDPLHGPRAAEMVRQLAAANLLPLEPHRLELLARAIHNHTGGPPSTDPTIGLCQDADRLNLWRIGVRPVASHLSTEAARQPQRIEAHRNLPGQAIPWSELFEMLQKARG